MDLHDNSDIRAMDAEGGPHAPCADPHARAQPPLDSGGRLGGEDRAGDRVLVETKEKFEDDSFERPN